MNFLDFETLIRGILGILGLLGLLIVFLLKYAKKTALIVTQKLSQGMMKVLLFEILSTDRLPKDIDLNLSGFGLFQKSGLDK